MSGHALSFMLLTALAVSITACDPNAGSGTRDTTAIADTAAVASRGLVGTWSLDATTKEWLPRACVVLDFASADEPTFRLTREEGALYVRFNEPARSVWRSDLHDNLFDGLQILPTTEAGRFCGRETPVRLRLQEAGPGVLHGVWKTPHCGFCPDRHFGATRVDD